MDRLKIFLGLNVDYKKFTGPSKSSLYLRYYAKVRNEWRGSSLRLNAWTPQSRRNLPVVAHR